MYKSLILLSCISLSIHANKPQESAPVSPAHQRMSGATRATALAATAAAGFALCPTTIVAGPGATAGCAAKFGALFGAILAASTMQELYSTKSTPITK